MLFTFAGIAVLQATAIQMETNTDEQTQKKPASAFPNMAKMLPMAVLLCGAPQVSAEEYLFTGSDAITSTDYTKANTLYPEHMTLTVPYHGQDLVLDLNVDRSSPDITNLADDDSTEIIPTNPEDWRCTYTGEVVGEPGSSVVMNVCQNTGIRGIITTESNDMIEIRPTDMTSDAAGKHHLGQHVVYNVQDLPVSPEFADEIAVASEFIDLLNSENTTDTDVINAQDAWDSYHFTGRLVADERFKTVYANAYAPGWEEYRNLLVAGLRPQWDTPGCNIFHDWGTVNGRRKCVQMSYPGYTGGSAGLLVPDSDMCNYLTSQIADWKEQYYNNTNNLIILTSFNNAGSVNCKYVDGICSTRFSAGVANLRTNTWPDGTYSYFHHLVVIINAISRNMGISTTAARPFYQSSPLDYTASAHASTRFNMDSHTRSCFTRFIS